jgi:hypothetical protein
MRHPLRNLILLAAFLVLLYGADRVAAHLAESKIAAVVETDAHLHEKPQVSVHGFPFLTQAAGGRYDRIEVTAHDIFNSSTGGAGSTTVVNFDGVHIPASKAISGQVHDVPVDRVSGRVDVTFADIEAASKVPGLTVQPVVGHPDQLLVGESVTVLGVQVSVSVTTEVSLSDNTITLKATDLKIPGGITLPAPLLDQIRSKAGFGVKVPGLSSGVALTSVSVAPDAVVATLRADNIVLKH